MSGSGGGSGHETSSPKNCESLSIKTQLASPKPTVISKLKIGDFLTIDLTPPRGPVQAITGDGEIAGAILSPTIAQLIECINDGHIYKAKVLEIKGGNCQILITHS